MISISPSQKGRKQLETNHEQWILELLAERNPQVIEVLYDIFGRLAFSLAYRVLGDFAAAEDAVQEAFLAMWRNLDAYREDKGSLRTWVCTIVHRRAIDALRRRRDVKPLADIGMSSEMPRSTSDPWNEVVAGLERGHVRRALLELPNEQRQAIELAYFDGYSQSDISKILEIPLGTVKGRARAALRKLRTLLEAQEAWQWPS